MPLSTDERLHLIEMYATGYADVMAALDAITPEEMEAREAMLPLLRLLTGEQWLLAGMHSEFGAMTADDWLSFYGLHARDHAEQIRRARAAAKR